LTLSNANAGKSPGKGSEQDPGRRRLEHDRTTRNTMWVPKKSSEFMQLAFEEVDFEVSHRQSRVTNGSYEKVADAKR